MPDRLSRLLDDGRRTIEVLPEELDESRRRRELLVTGVKSAFPGSRVYFNGSVAHGDATTPLNDIDLGVVVADITGYGPDGNGPEPLMDDAADAIRDHLKDEFPKLTVTVKGQRRAVLVRFGDPVTTGQPDFTADVIVALDNPTGDGLYIPNTDLPEQWDRADPETHTELILDAVAATDVVFARTVRLLKHWRNHHGKPLCSWNIKALALECIDRPMPLVQALDIFFTHAAAEIADGPTQDPAGVADPIETNIPRKEAAFKLRTARDKVQKAVKDEAEGRPASAQQALHWLLPGVVPEPDPSAVLKEVSRNPATATTATPTRAWAP
jgi:hypothetical protein